MMDLGLSGGTAISRSSRDVGGALSVEPVGRAPQIVRAMRLAAFVAIAASVGTASTASAGKPDAVGGGYADSGLLGGYYDSASFEGEPTFLRRDVRIDFIWGNGRPVGGSISEPHRSFPATGFSVRWKGRVIPRFSEPYRFVASSDGSMEVRIRAPGEQDWITAVSADGRAGVVTSDSITLESGKLYDIEIAYRATTGEPRCTLSWSSPSTPQEIIDPVRQQGLNAASIVRYVWADAMKTARWGAQRDTVDEQSWPTRSGAELILTEGSHEDPTFGGTYRVRFNGIAAPKWSCCGSLVFIVGGEPLWRALPRGTGYNAATNQTVATMEVEGSRTMMFFEDASRGRGGGGGVTDVRFMRPLSPGSSRAHRFDEVVYRPFKRLLQDDFTTIRWLEGANKKTETEWKDRARPGNAFFWNDAGQENWEYLVMLANETGKDLSITTPIGANDEYFENLALLFRYGSDGDQPYRAPTPKPAYPPLNPNLRVYIEVGNEIWNWPFGSTAYCRELSIAEAEADSSTWRAMNFDGVLDDPGSIVSIRRYLAYRTAKASEAFREVYGDAGMGSRVRPLLHYQYDNFQGTAGHSLFFIDEYFGNVRPEVPEPHPVNYYLWGGGGATYYGLANSDGAQSHTVLADASFEEVDVPPGQRVVAPKGSPWTFRGAAGVVRPVEPGSIAELEDLAEPIDGERYAYLRSGGSISQRVEFTRPGFYAISFSAAGNGKDGAAHVPFDIFVDDTKVSPFTQSDIRTARRSWSLGGWGRRTDSMEEDWGSAVFEVKAPGPRTIRFVARAGPQHVLIDNVRIASVDAIVESGFDVGVAQGQHGSPDIAFQFRAEAKYPRTFGLEVVSYESGWSVGGDFHQKPIQNWTKFKDARAREVNDEMIRLWDLSGSFMTVWGVYLYFPEYDLEGAASYPIMQSFRAAAERLRAEPTYGAELPATLGPKDADWAHTYEQPSDNDQPWWHQYVPWLSNPGEVTWHSWMLIAPRTSRYRAQVTAEGKGTIRVEIDGTPVSGDVAVAASLPVIDVDLTQGAHAIRVIAKGGAEVKTVEVTP